MVDKLLIYRYDDSGVGNVKRAKSFEKSTWLVSLLIQRLEVCL